MKIILRGGNFVNKGAEAMLCTVQNEIGQRIPAADFHLKASDKNPVEGEGLHPFYRASGLSGTFKRVSGTLRTVASQPSLLPFVLQTPKQFSRIDEHLFDANAIIDISGFAYGDTWGERPLTDTLNHVVYCKQKNIPYVFMPQSWGSFNKSNLATNMQKMYEQCTALYTRDEESRKYVAGAVGIDVKDVLISPDIAFRFKGDAHEAGSAILQKVGIPATGRRIIAIVPNVRVYERMQGELENNEYVKTLVDIVRHCKSFDAAIVIMPHEFRVNSKRHDDRLICNLVKAAFADDADVVSLVDVLPASLIKSILSHADMVIASRYHSIIASLSNRIPAVVIGWSHKYVELMREVGLPEYVVNYEEIDKDALQSIISKAWTDREASNQVLQERLPVIEQRVDSVLDHVASLVNRQT